MKIGHLLRHLWLDTGDARRAVGVEGLARIEASIRSSEASHTGEICVCVEAALPLDHLWRHIRYRENFDHLTRERAIELFGTQRVWDTESNNGVLIYLQLAEHRLEILADRGVDRHVEQTHWDSVVAEVSNALRDGRLVEGLVHAVDAVGRVLQRHFPTSGAVSGGGNADELPDRPMIL